jgi:FtsZ-binding cell division protein ZapB
MDNITRAKVRLATKEGRPIDDALVTLNDLVNNELREVRRQKKELIKENRHLRNQIEELQSETKTGGSPMTKDQQPADRPLRLRDLTAQELLHIRQKRAELGKQKYGDDHLQRYGCEDMREEVDDVINILQLTFDRIKRQAPEVTEDLQVHLYAHEVQLMALLLMKAILKFEARLPDYVVTDEKGGERPGWDDIRRARVESVDSE